MDNITIVKLDPQGREMWRYRGRILELKDRKIVLEAFFDRADMEIHGMMLRKGDRFLETYYTDRWYNLFEIHDLANEELRGWYCNICTPARMEGGVLSYIDLALDLLVFPDGRQIVVDQEEFEALQIPLTMHTQAREALKDLQSQFRAGRLAAGFQPGEV